VRSIRLLITCVGGRATPSLIKSLKSSAVIDYTLIGVDSVSVGKSKDSLECYYRVPSGDNTGYIDRLLEIALKEKIDFILPGSDEEAIAISRNKGKFSSLGIIPIVSNAEVLELISDKLKTYKALEACNLRVPEYKITNSVDEIIEFLNQYQYPKKTVVLKPASGRGGRGLYVFEGEDCPPFWLGSGSRETRVAREQFTNRLLSEAACKDGLIMPALTTPVYDVDIMAIRGEVNAVVVRERINPSGIPFQGNKIKANDLIMEYCVKVANILKLDGLHDIDLMTNSKGEPCIIEVNPRPSGSLAASLVAGIPMVDIAILSLLNEKVPEVPSKLHTKVLMDIDDMMYIASYEGN